MSQLKVYKASAGSGKTHTLTEEYLKLAALYPDNFKRILAVTFTNKAAEEMKQRILASLNHIITEGKKAPFYAVFQKMDEKANEEVHVKRAKSLRDSILHDYSYFSLGTIDSFIQRVIKSFTYEIGIESGYRIELDTEKVLNDLTELLYKQIDSDESLRNWLIHYANYKMDDGKSWDFRAEIKELAKEIFKEQFQSFSSDETDYNLKEFLDYFNDLNSIKERFEKAMRDCGKEAILMVEKSGIQIEEHGRNLKTLLNYLTKTIINQPKEDSFIPNATVQKMINNVDSWFNKTARSDILQDAKELYKLLNPVLVKADAIFNGQYPDYLAANNVQSGFHAFGIISKIAALLPGYRADNNLLLISDTTRILKEIIAGNEAPFIYEKIGNRFKHILIDEFQDTSGFQWENFKPLISNGLSEGNENLIVGDIKQSIYRWRGGDWNILMSKLEKEIGQNYLSNKSLDTNWRSKKNILDFNNAIFRHISELMQEVFDNEYAEGIGIQPDGPENQFFKGIISRAYTDVFQKLPDQEDKAGGRVQLKFIQLESNENKSEWHQRVANELPVIIDELLKKKNYKPGDIAMLVRKNEEGKKIARILLDYQQVNTDAVKYQIISSESLMLANSPVVQVLVDAMHFLHNADDMIHLHALLARFVLLNHPETDLDHQHFNMYDKGSHKHFLPIEFFERFEYLKKLNIYDLSEELSQIFKLNRFDGQFPYLQSFLDIIHEFGTNETADLSSFISWWADKGQTFALQLSDQPDAVKILSVHRSKGLAFKIVIIPFCDWEIKPQSSLNNIIWTSSDIEPFNRLKRFPIVYRTNLKKSLFWKEYFHELLYTMIDSLNILYVAFTRPKEELIILSPFKEKKEQKFNTIAELLHYVITNSLPDKGLIDLKLNYSSDDRIFKLDDNYENTDVKKPANVTNNISPFIIYPSDKADWNSKIHIMQHADDFFIQSLEYIKTHVDYGNLMHAIFSKIRNERSIEAIVDEFYYAGKIGFSERAALIKDVKEMISQKEVADWFSDRWQVKAEDAILSASGQIRIPDRVLIRPGETFVIDFKFGEQDKESKKQVLEYMDLLRSMDYEGVKGFIYYAKKNVVEEVF